MGGMLVAPGITGGVKKGTIHVRCTLYSRFITLPYESGLIIFFSFHPDKSFPSLAALRLCGLKNTSTREEGPIFGGGML